MNIEIKEDAPTNSVSSGEISGVGVSNTILPNQSEPGVKKIKRKIMPLMAFVNRNIHKRVK